MNSIQNFTHSWLDLGNLDEKKVFINDPLIPMDKKDNHDIRYSGYWIMHQNEVYFFKVTNASSLLNELLGKKVSEEFKIPTKNYILCKGFAKINGKREEFYGFMSKYEREESKSYQTLKEEVITRIPYAFRKNYQVMKENLRPDLLNWIQKIIIRDFYTNEMDRADDEILVYQKDNQFILSPLFDYEFEFEFDWKFSSFYNLGSILTIDFQKKEIKEIFKPLFQKIETLNLCTLLSELEKEKNLRICEEEKERISKFQRLKKEQIQNLFF